MEILFTILAILVIIASILVTVVVLLQNGKGGGLASNFVAGNQTFGVRQTADILEKITWGLAVVILILAVSTNFIPHKGASGNSDTVTDSVLDKTGAKAVENEAFTQDAQTINLNEAQQSTENQPAAPEEK